MSFRVRRLSDDSPRRRVPWASVLRFALLVARPLTLIYGDWKRRHEEEERAERRRFWMTAGATGVIALLLAALLWIGVARAWTILRGVSLGTAFSVASADIPTDAHGHTNILLLGQGDEAGENLTDTIMIASIDPGTHSAVLLSLPRDLYLLKREGLKPGKINSTYRDFLIRFKREGKEGAEASFAALNALKDELGDALTMDIHGVVKVGFDGFIAAVDALGGVDVDVPEDIVDTEFPTADYGYETFSIKAGPQHLDGATALKYARSRHTTSDFDRSGRQQQILQAMATRVREQGLLGKAQAIVAIQEILRDHVEMTLTLPQLMSLAKSGIQIDRANIITMQLSDRNGLYGDIVLPGGFLYTPPRDQFDGQSVLLPVSIPEFPVTWKQLQTLKNLLIDERTPYINRSPIAVLNAGAVSGMARKLANEITRYGLRDVDLVANATLDDQAASVIAADEAGKTLATFLSALLGIPMGDLPADLPPDERRSVTLLLGKDYRFAPFQDRYTPAP